jgi:hypothetical protein
MPNSKKTEKGISIVTTVEDTKSLVELVDNQIQILIQGYFYHIKSLPTFMEKGHLHPFCMQNTLHFQEQYQNMLKVQQLNFSNAFCNMTNAK